MNNDSQDNSQISSRNQEHPIIVFNEAEEIPEEKTDIDTNEGSKKEGRPSINMYLSACVFSIIIYLLCAYASKVSFLEVLDREIPLVILFTLILTEASIEGYTRISYVVYVIVGCILYLIHPSYAFFVAVAFMGNVIVYFMNKIYYNEYDYRNIKETDSKNFFVSHLLRVRYYLILSLTLFVVFLLLGYFYPTVFQSVVMPTIQGMNEGVQQGTVKLETVSLFVNNFSVAISIIFGGLYFSTSSVYLVVFNALVVGFTACLMDLKHFLAFTLPHGVLELTAIIIAGAAGFRVTDAIISILGGIKLKGEDRQKLFVDKVEIACKMLADVFVMLVIITVLLLIAAFIEANLTIPLGETITKMF